MYNVIESFEICGVIKFSILFVCPSLQIVVIREKNPTWNVSPLWTPSIAFLLWHMAANAWTHSFVPDFRSSAILKNDCKFGKGAFITLGLLLTATSRSYGGRWCEQTTVNRLWTVLIAATNWNSTNYLVTMPRKKRRAHTQKDQSINFIKLVFQIGYAGTLLLLFT